VRAIKPDCCQCVYFIYTALRTAQCFLRISVIVLTIDNDALSLYELSVTFSCAQMNVPKRCFVDDSGLTEATMLSSVAAHWLVSLVIVTNIERVLLWSLPPIPQLRERRPLCFGNVCLFYTHFFHAMSQKWPFFHVLNC